MEYNLNSNCKGYALAELCIALVILGILLSALVPSFNGLYSMYGTWITKTRQDKIIRALANHVLLTGYLPAPYKDGRNGNPDIGSIPYQELGLRFEDSLDSKNIPFVYVRNPLLSNSRFYNAKNLDYDVTKESFDLCDVKLDLEPQGLILKLEGKEIKAPHQIIAFVILNGKHLSVVTNSNAKILVEIPSQEKNRVIYVTNYNLVSEYMHFPCKEVTKKEPSVSAKNRQWSDGY